MNILSMVSEAGRIDFTWLIPFLFLFIVAYLLPKVRRKNDIRDEGVIDLYHHTSRRLYCTSETCRILTEDEASNIDMLRKQKRLLRARFVKIEENKTADVWGNGEPGRIYGYQYLVV